MLGVKEEGIMRQKNEGVRFGEQGGVRERLSMDHMQGPKWVDVTNSGCSSDSFRGCVYYKALELPECHNSSSSCNAQPHSPPCAFVQETEIKGENL